MANRPAKTSAPAKDAKGKDAQTDASQTLLTEPVDVVDGIPDRAARRPKWLLIVLAVLFLAYMAFLIAVKILGSP